MHRRSFLGKMAIGTLVAAYAPGSLRADTRPELVLLGDSIRLGYQSIVEYALQDHLSVWGPEENGRTSAHLLYNAVPWLKHRNPQIAHLNAGLHDLRTLYFDAPPGQTVIPIDQYEENVRRILRFVQEQTEAQPIWATITPVRDELVRKQHHASQDFTRYNEDVIRYNNAARRVAQDLAVPVNDLYQVAWDAGLDKIQQNDGVHFTDEGNKLLAQGVAKAIKPYL